MKASKERMIKACLMMDAAMPSEGMLYNDTDTINTYASELATIQTETYVATGAVSSEIYSEASLFPISKKMSKREGRSYAVDTLCSAQGAQ